MEALASASLWAARGCEADFRTKLQAVCYKDARKEKKTEALNIPILEDILRRQSTHSIENISQDVFQSPLCGREDYQSDPNACKRAGMRSTDCARAAKNTDFDHHRVPVILTMKEA